MTSPAPRHALGWILLMGYTSILKAIQFCQCCHQLLSALTPSAALGCAKGFVHRVKISPAVAPVLQKLRRLPLSFRDAVSEEIHLLLRLDIIGRMDAWPWVSPIVVDRKTEKVGCYSYVCGSVAIT